MKLNFTTFLITLLGFINMASACLTVDFAYNNDEQVIPWLVVQDNGVLVMSLGLTRLGREIDIQQMISPQVNGWYGFVRNDGELNWSASFEIPSGINTGYFGLGKRCVAYGGANGCSVYWVNGGMWC